MVFLSGATAEKKPSGFGRTSDAGDVLAVSANGSQQPRRVLRSGGICLLQASLGSNIQINFPLWDYFIEPDR